MVSGRLSLWSGLAKCSKAVMREGRKAGVKTYQALCFCKLYAAYYAMHQAVEVSELTSCNGLHMWVNGSMVPWGLKQALKECSLLLTDDTSRRLLQLST